jgi:hypothetical protein
VRRLILLFALVAGVVLAPAAGAAIDVGITSPHDGAHSLSGVVPVSIDASADAGIYSVQLEVDGALYGIPDTTSLGSFQYEIDWNTTGLASGNHTLAVIATDWSQLGGGVQQLSAPITVDLGPAYPTISLLVPQPYTFARGTLTLASAVGGGQPPTNVMFSVDGNPLSSSSWDTGSAADGLHTVSATVTDARGKTATASAQLTVDNTAPTTYLISPSASTYFQDSLPVAAHADDAYGVASVQFLIDGSPAGAPVTTPDASGGGYTYSGSLDISAISKGSHTVTDVATDSAGNTTVSAPVTFMVGVAPPQVSLAAPADWTLARGTVQVSASPSGGTPPYSLQLSVDGVAAAPPVMSAPFSFNWDTTKLSDGLHTLSVSVTDSDGEVASSPVVHQTVDNTPPSTYLISPAPGGYFNGTLAVSAHASDTSGIGAVQYEIDGNPSGPALVAPDSAGGYTYSASLDISALAPGVHTLTESATDSAGNTTTITPVSFTVASAGALQVTVASPSDWAFARGSETVTATPSGGNGPYSVQFSVDGAATGSPVTGAPYSFSWDTTKTFDGTYTLTATVTDHDGHTTTSPAVHQTVDNTPPSTYLISPGAGGYFSGTLAVSAHASDASGIGAVQFKIDGTPAGTTLVAPDTAGGYTYSTSLDISKLTAGHHTLTVVATDSAGETATSTAVQFTVSSSALTVALPLPPDWTFARGTVPVSADPSGGNGAYSVQLYVDGTAAGSPDTTAPYNFSWDTTKTSDGPHTLTAVVTDTDSDTATSSVVHVTVDNTAPSTYLISPAPGGYFNGTLAVSAHASDGSGIATVQYQIDGKPAGAPLTAPDTAGGYAYSASLDISKLTAGHHTLDDVATDAAGNTATSAPVSFTVSSGPPQVVLTLPPDWTFGHGTVPVTASPSGGVTPYSLQLYVDGTPSGSPISTSSPYTFSWDTTKLNDGTHTVSVGLTDADGDTATSATVHITVDNTAPTTYLVSPAAGAWFTGALPVSAHASDAYGIASIQYQIDGNPAGPALLAPDTAGGYTYSTSLDLSKLPAGMHILTEIATDNGGNTTTSAPVSFGVGAAPGTVTITSPANISYTRKTVTVTATVAGGTPPFTGTLAVDGTQTTLSPTVTGSTLSFTLDTTKLADGSHTLAVTITDAAKLSATSPLLDVTVDNTSPTAAMYQPTPLAGYSYARSNGPTSLQVHASDAYGIKSVQFTIDGSPVGALLTKPDTPGGYLYSLTFDTSTLKAGMHSISALVTDSAGNTTNAAALSLKSGPIVYVPVLNYHGIEGPLDSEPDIYDETSAQADAELSYLKANGYQSITLPQFETWLQTDTLPAGITKPVLITVDDALTDELAWDPLLQKYGFKAVLYVVTGYADNTTPGADDPTGNMSWSQIQSLAANGRWTIAFHAGQYGHGDYSDPTTTIALSSTQTQSYSPNCWTYYNCLGTIKTTTTTGSGRTRKTTTTSAPETAALFESQVSGEITAGMAELKQKVPSADMTSWACPWNACGQWTNFYNDPSGTIQNWFPSFAASKFQVVFMQTDPITYGLASGTVGPLNADNRRYRFEVHTDTTIQQFATALTDPAFANN